MSQGFADVIYYDLNIQNANIFTIGAQNTAFETPVTLSIDSTAPIIQDPSQYYGSIIRMKFPGWSIPLIQFHVQTSGGVVTDPITKGIYSFTLQYGSTVSDQIYYIFQPQLLDPTIPIPKIGAPIQNLLTPYYYLFDYPWIVKIMNVALASAMDSLKTKVGGALDTANTPFFHYDGTTGLITLYTDPNFFGEIENPVSIYFNNPSYVYLTGFTFNNLSGSQLVDGRENLLIINNPNNINIVTINSIQWIKTAQLYVSLEYMSELNSIEVSTQMAVRPLNYNITPISDGGSIPQQNIGFSNIITDFLPDISQPAPGISSYQFIYNASSLYRVFEFTKGDPLREIQATFHWTDNYGNRHPLYQPKGQSTNILFMFIKKSLYSPSLQIIDGQVQLPGRPSVQYVSGKV